MRRISAANSDASSPPVPARISRITFFSSFGSLGTRSSFRSFSVCSRRACNARREQTENDLKLLLVQIIFGLFTSCLQRFNFYARKFAHLFVFAVLLQVERARKLSFDILQSAIFLDNVTKAAMLLCSLGVGGRIRQQF